MAVTTSVIKCKPGAYTALSSGEVNVSFRILRMIGTTVARLAAGSSAPTADTTGFVHINNRKWKEFSALTSNLYLMPMTTELEVEVIKVSS